MSRASCVVDNEGSKLVYDRAASDLSDLKKKDFTFTISPAPGGKDMAEFQMLRNNEMVRYHQSEPYPAGALQLKGLDVNKVSCIVKLKKKTEIDLSQYFEN